MHPVKLDKGEVVLLKQAFRDKDWRILPTFKLRYVYQRFTKNQGHIQEIAKLAREKLDPAKYFK